MSELVSSSAEAKILKVDASQGVVYGMAIVCTIDGAPYFDLQDDHITQDAMLKATTDFMEDVRVNKDMHAGESTGQVIHSFPLTDDIKKAFNINSNLTGWMVGVKPSPESLQKFVNGEYTGFSIGGLSSSHEVSDA
jgi:hypothetical protein